MIEALRYFYYYALGKYFLKTPPIITLFVTSFCNSRCEHCFYWKKLRALGKHLSWKAARKISRKLKHVELLLISGGEPYLNPELSKIVETFWKGNGVRSVSIATNSLATQVIINETTKILKLSKNLTVVVCLSLDGTEKIHDKIRGVKGSFKGVQKTYRQLLKLSVNYPNLRIKFNATVNNENYKSLYTLIDQIPLQFPNNWNLTLSLIRGDPFNSSLILPKFDKLKKLFDYKEGKLRGNRPQISRFLGKMVFRAQLETLKKKKRVVPCEAGKLTRVYYEDGTEADCELIKENSGKCFCTQEGVLGPSLIAHPETILRLILQR